MLMDYWVNGQKDISSLHLFTVIGYIGHLIFYPPSIDGQFVPVIIMVKLKYDINQ